MKIIILKFYMLAADNVDYMYPSGIVEMEKSITR